MSFETRRQAVLEKMNDNELMILYSGIENHISLDAYFPFEVNRQFYYLTGINRKNVILVLHKSNPSTMTLFVKKVDKLEEKWMGKQLTVEEAKMTSKINSVMYLDDFESYIDRLMINYSIDTVYFDTYKHAQNDLDDYNLTKAKAFKNNYFSVKIKNAFDIICKLRMQKDDEEIRRVKHAIDITHSGLNYVLDTLKPGMYENQVQANFEYMIKYCGATGPSFSTIAGAGYNGTMLHYSSNECLCKDGDLILLDLGAKVEGYCADITRTYPVNGKFSDRQKVIYNIVLKANQEVAKVAKPGMSLNDLNNICKNVLAAGLKEIGLIEKDEELIKYYMHGVSHHLGLDVHDASLNRDAKLEPGAIITNEPGLYIDEESIGIRIEDDLLITENGCEVLSKDIIRTIEEIEDYMAK